MKPRRSLRVLAVAVAAALAAGVVVAVVRASDGAFSGEYALTGSFAKAGEGLHSGSAVTYRGVQVGRVATIALVRRRAVVGMRIDRSFRVPADALATIRPINVFGAEEVQLTFGPHDGGAALPAGGTVAHTAVSAELGDLFAAADPLLAKIDAPDLSSLVSDLAAASVNEGPTVAASIDDGARLADLLDRTLPAQLGALDSFSAFQRALTPTASSFNAIARASNTALPAFNSASAAYQKLLTTLAPFAEDLAQLLSAYHPDIETLLHAGDNVARMLLTRQSDVGQVIAGLAVYMQRFADALSPNEVLPDGSHFGYFQTFVLFGDINTFVCDLLAPASPGLSFLEPLQQALTGAGTPLDCTSQLHAFDAAQASGAAPASSSTASAQAGQKLSTDTYQAVTAPQPTTQTGLGGLMGSLLGTGSGTSGGGGLLGGGSSGTNAGGGGGGLLGGLP
ncbi:MAG TPA: MCE family protein [Acidimicrobiales bacterium]|nr:MCE family protein [Acidimicrobiales bacterium]